jgi:hypothetical protein
MPQAQLRAPRSGTDSVSWEDLVEDSATGGRLTADSRKRFGGGDEGMADQPAPTGDPQRAGVPDGSSADSRSQPDDPAPSSWAGLLQSLGLRREPEEDPQSAAQGSPPPPNAPPPSPSSPPPSPPNGDPGRPVTQTAYPLRPGLRTHGPAQSPPQSQVPVLHHAGAPGSPASPPQGAQQVPATTPRHAREVRPDFTYLPYGAGAAPWSGSDEEWQPGPVDPAAPPEGSTASRRPLLVVALVVMLVLLLLGIGLAVWRILAGISDGGGESPGSSQPILAGGEPGDDLLSALRGQGFSCSQVSVQPTIETCFAGGGPVSQPLRQYAWRVSLQTDDSDVVHRIDASSQSEGGGSVVQQGWTTIVDAAAATVFSDDPAAFRSAVSTDAPMKFGDWSGGVVYHTDTLHSFSFSRSDVTAGFTPGPPLQATATEITARALGWGFSCPPTHSGVSCSRTSRNGIFTIDTYTYRGETKNARLSASTPYGGRLNTHAAQLFLTKAAATMLGSDVATDWLRGRFDGGVYSVVFNGYLLELNPSNYGAGLNFRLRITGFSW